MLPHRVLLVEDEAPKLRHISEFLQDAIVDPDLVVARSVTSAVEQLETSSFDLIVLDMSLPTFDFTEQELGGRPQGFGGTEVMRHMDMSGCSTPVIVVTGYEVFMSGGGGQLNIEQLRRDLHEEFGHILIGVLHYSSAIEEWKAELLGFIRGM